MTIQLEDNYNDVLTKAMRGRRIGREDLSQRSGVPVDAIQRLLDGTFDETAARQVAPALELGVDALVALGHGSYSPLVPPPVGLACFNTPYSDFYVNAFMAWCPKTHEAVVFDTGSECAPILEEARMRNLKITLILVTHTHPDHIHDLAALKTATGAPAYVSSLEPTPGADPAEPGATFKVGELVIEGRRTSGHSKGGMTWVVTGLGRPLAVVGDALFAGSMGGGIVSFDDALANNRSQIFTLPDDTVICPGHGPLTSVQHEKAHNPFYPEFHALAHREH